MALPSLLTRLLPSRLLPVVVNQLAERSRREILERTAGYSPESVPELRGYVRARARSVVKRHAEQYLAGEGLALASQREAVLAQTLEKATEFVLTELRQAMRTPARRWKVA